MHPYRMQRLIKERGKDDVVNVQRRASIYQTISQLEKAGLIKVRETAQDENRPERTVYELTSQGQQTALVWLREILSTPSQEFPEFPAAVSFLPLLTPEDALSQLELRSQRISDRMADIDDSTKAALAFLPRLFVLENEYMRAMLETELKWVRALIADLKAGTITWTHEWLRGFVPPESDPDSE
jgi:DNA-binding PadR family transcriptional regulator